MILSCRYSILQTEAVPFVKIPDTIQMHRANPTFWYYSVEGRVYRKGKEKLNKAELKRHYMKKRSEVVAVWI